MRLRLGMTLFALALLSACDDSSQQCGNGVVEGEEECDDGKLLSNDGCSEDCLIEYPACGDGRVDANEGCDDGNTSDGDGCDHLCQVEAPPPACGDGRVDANEGCDDGNTIDGDGCASGCAVEAGYACAGAPSACVPVCSDGLVISTEACDDANLLDGDGCSAQCGVEAGYSCPTPGVLCEAVCGDGLLLGSETCDDANTTSGDGCAAGCVVESGWACAVPGQPCATVCGDGLITGLENCDDANATDGDGCSAVCAIEVGWQCAATGAPCGPLCGDGLIIGSEVCDDGNAVSDDGCDGSCTSEVGWSCGLAGQPCTSICADGVVVGVEGCDDGNLVDADGCSAACALEPGWTCAVAGTACETTCGDGITAGLEVCDDGNLVDHDGCTSTCDHEPGWNCVPAGWGLASRWDPTPEYSSTCNPAGPWSYGYKVTRVGSWILFPSSGGTAWFDPAITVLGTPAIWKNTGTSSSYGVPPGSLSLHGGAHDEYATLRWTAPRDGAFAVRAQTFLGDSGETEGVLSVNGNVIVHSTTNLQPIYVWEGALTAGDTVDLSVGPRPAFYFGNTPFTLTIRDLAAGTSTSGWSCLPAGVVTPPAPGLVIAADSVAGFSSEQGRCGWRYGYATKSTATPFVDMPEHDPAQERWQAQDATYWTQVTAHQQHPNGAVVNAGRTPVEHWAVRRWFSDAAGTVTITGTARKVASGGNGVELAVRVDGVAVLERFIAGNDVTGAPFTLTATVAEGSAIDFVLGTHAGDSVTDGTTIEAQIWR
ncbi:DUF4215 domain-containing protein [Myxococcota bacterium]|nr:DUF4215 domain-containing protein [Myxococcota bacterium]